MTDTTTPPLTALVDNASLVRSLSCHAQRAVRADRVHGEFLWYAHVVHTHAARPTDFFTQWEPARFVREPSGTWTVRVLPHSDAFAVLGVLELPRGEFGECNDWIAHLRVFSSLQHMLDTHVREGRPPLVRRALAEPQGALATDTIAITQ
jgi:hypothetical protein